MKTKTINLSDQRMRLNKDQMKKITARLEVSGDCAGTGDACAPWMNINCCSGNYCDTDINGPHCYKA